MRPSVLNPLFASASGIKGIGQKLDKVLAKFLRGDSAASPRIVDLLFHLPTGIVDRRFRPCIADLPQKGIVTIEVKVGRHKPPPPFNKRLPYRVEVSDQTGTLTLVFFHAFVDHLNRSLPEGETRFISGEISWYGKEP
ncbi:MAG TPA: ATP-dependent DNA helicase RecG, partial [Aestuariivirga sp.]